MPLSELRAIQDTVVRPALRRVAGVADIVTMGGALQEIQVRANPQALVKFGLSFQQLQDALSHNSANGVQPTTGTELMATINGSTIRSARGNSTSRTARATPRPVPSAKPASASNSVTPAAAAMIGKSETARVTMAETAGRM